VEARLKRRAAVAMLALLAASCSATVTSKPVVVVIENGYNELFIRTGCNQDKPVANCDYEGMAKMRSVERQVTSEAQALSGCHGVVLLQTDKDSDEVAYSGKYDILKAWHLRLEIDVAHMDGPPGWVLFPPGTTRFDEGTGKPAAIAARLCAIVRGVGAAID
jgi:hypothetical protein